MKFKNTLYIALLLICVLVAGAHADIKYTQTMTVGADANATPMMRMGHYVAPGKERNDTEMTIGNYTSKEALITICQTQQIIHLDEALKIYAITDRDSTVSSNIPATENGESSHEKAGTGKIVVNVKVTDLNSEKVAGWDTKHYMVEMHTESSGCVGDRTSDIKMELWVADVKDAHGCKADVDYGAILGQQGSGKCKVTYETTGDYARLGNIWNGLIMRQKIYDKEGKLTMLQEVTSLSQAKLDDSVFATPKDFTKLSIDDYNNQRQQAMMSALMSDSKNDSRKTENTEDNDQNRDKEKKQKSKNRGFRIPKLPF